MKKFLYNKKTKIVVSISICIILNFSLNVHARYTYFERNEEEILTKGVTYIKSLQVTDGGLLDVYILKVPLNDPYIELKPVYLKSQLGLKDYTTNLLGNNGAIAGVNGDFFNMSGAVSPVVGTMVRDGVVVSSDSIINSDKNAFATFLLDNQNNPIINYLNIDIDFLINGIGYFKIMEYNKTSDMIYANYIDRKYMSDTSSIDAQFPNVTKVVVENNIITYVSQMGETVTVPENGFIITIPEASVEYFTSVLKVGDRGEIKVGGTIDMETIKTAIGGAGKILSNGEIVHDSGFVASGLQPRTAIGFNQDKTEIILMVVDGRTHSIGATHEDMAQFLLKYGVTDAMHFDGGGSSSMGVKGLNDDYVKLVNTPSDGLQRKVVNAIGVFNNSSIGNFNNLIFKLKDDVIFKNTLVPLGIVGVDQYLNEVPIDVSLIQKDIVVGSGEFINNEFLPTSEGEIEIIAQYNGSIISKKMLSDELVQIIPSQSSIEIGGGSSVEVLFKGMGKRGNESTVYGGINYEVVPSTLGTMSNNIFTATNSGAGYIKASVGEIVAYVPVYVGSQERQLTSFENDIPLTFRGSPDFLMGNFSFNSQTVIDKNNSVEFNYRFEAIQNIQSAYLDFSAPITINKNANSISLYVKGDNSGNALRTKLTDSNGEEILLDFTSNINFNDWQRLTVNLPGNAAYPLSLDSIYVETLMNFNIYNFTLYFDNLSVEEKVSYEKIAVPEQSVTFVDPLNVSLSDGIEQGFDITLSGSISKWDSTVQRVIDKLTFNSSRVIFAGTANDIGDLGIPTFRWNSTYSINVHENVSIIQISASNGGIMDTDISQWGKFSNDIKQSTGEHAIIMIDKNPLNFKNSNEKDLFMLALEDLAKLGKTIFVVSTEGTATSKKIVNGVRYINIGSLFKDDGSINENFSVLRLRVNGSDIKYSFQQV